MQFEGTTYRPPPEADNMLLQVTVGCAHNRCSYCSMYRDVDFRVVEMEQIECDLQEARQIFRNAKRIFLVNGDAFVLPAKRLCRIARRIHHYFPECETITMYGSINNIRQKSDIDLQMLREHGINDLYVGLESGWDEVLKAVNKGHDIAEAICQLDRLNICGISHMALLMLGIAGAGRGLENARRTASLLNRTGPKMVWAGTLAVFEGTELFAEMKQGVFAHPTELEILEEEKELLRNIELIDVPFFGIHPTNAVPVQGVLPHSREYMIGLIDSTVSQYGKEALDTVFERNTL